MKLVEQHIIKSNDQRYKDLCVLMSYAKNLYNTVSYVIRQHYFRLSGQYYTNDISNDNEHKYLNYYDVNKLLKESNNECYRSLPANTSQEVLKQVDQNYRSFFKLLDIKQQGKYDAKINIPKYKKANALVGLTYNLMTFIQQKDFKTKGEFYLPKAKHLKFKILNYKTCTQIRFIPRKNYILIEVIYEKREKDLKDNNQRYMAVDLGVNNLAACSSNYIESFIINGRPIKSINQFANKKIAQLQECLSKCQKDKHTSKRIQNTLLKRSNKIKSYFHRASKFIVYQCIENEINTLIIGKNKRWKHKAEIGKKNNQNFVQIPFELFINMLCYKAKLEGINVVLQEESYTSKASFFDNDYIATYGVDDEAFKPLGKRVKRGLYKTKEGLQINADLNGSLNILRKYLKVACDRIIPLASRGLVVRPAKYTFGKVELVNY